MSIPLHPLIFDPIFKPKIWGGRRLETVLGKALPPDIAIGESWELADILEDRSPVRNGPAAGRTISEMMDEWGKALLGDVPELEGRFPLLIKFLDACETLSIQVHPTEAQAAMGVAVKNEAWYVIAAEEDGFIYRGPKAGIRPAEFEAAAREGRWDDVLHRISVKAGDCYYLPSGTVHALGAGVLVAEVQTPSDVTYRLFDFNRIDAATGRPRDLHIDEALSCVLFDSHIGRGEARSHVASVWTAVTRLVTCQSFIIERVRMAEGVALPITYGGMVVWIMLEGRAEIKTEDGGNYAIQRGDVALFPAELTGATLRTPEPCLWLEVTIPQPSDLAEFPRPSRAELANPSEGFIQLGRDLGSDASRH